MQSSSAERSQCGCGGVGWGVRVCVIFNGFGYRDLFLDIVKYLTCDAGQRDPALLRTPGACLKGGWAWWEGGHEWERCFFGELKLYG